MLFSEQLNYYTTIEKVFQVLQYFTKAAILRCARIFCGALFKRFLAWKRGITKRQFIEIVPLLVVFDLPYSKYKVVKICSYSCRYQNQTFSLVSHSRRSCSTHVVLVSFLQHSCRTRVARVSLVSLMSQIFGKQLKLNLFQSTHTFWCLSFKLLSLHIFIQILKLY